MRKIGLVGGLFLGNFLFSVQVYAKTVFLVNDINQIDKVSSEVHKLMEEVSGIKVDIVGANEIAQGKKDLNEYDTIVCFIYGDKNSVNKFTPEVLETIKKRIENGATLFVTEEACGGIVLSYLGLVEAGKKSCWCPALKDSYFIVNYDENEPLFKGVKTYKGNPFDYSVSYWDSGDFDFLIWRVDNSMVYDNRFGVLKITKEPDKYLAKSFGTGWEVSKIYDAYPEWFLGKGRIILTGRRWTFDYKTGKGGYFGKAGRQILKNLAYGVALTTDNNSNNADSNKETSSYIYTVEIYKGWNNIGLPCKFETSKLANLFQNIKFVWVWDNENKNWRFWSPIGYFNNLATKYGLDIINTIEPLQGIWIYSKDYSNVKIDIGKCTYEKNNLQDYKIAVILNNSPNTYEEQAYIQKILKSLGLKVDIFVQGEKPLPETSENYDLVILDDTGYYSSPLYKNTVQWVINAHKKGIPVFIIGDDIACNIWNVKDLGNLIKAKACNSNSLGYKIPIKVVKDGAITNGKYGKIQDYTYDWDIDDTKVFENEVTVWLTANKEPVFYTYKDQYGKVAVYRANIYTPNSQTYKFTEILIKNTLIWLTSD